MRCPCWAIVSMPKNRQPEQANQDGPRVFKTRRSALVLPKQVKGLTLVSCGLGAAAKLVTAAG